MISLPGDGRTLLFLEARFRKKHLLNIKHHIYTAQNMLKINFIRKFCSQIYDKVFGNTGSINMKETAVITPLLFEFFLRPRTFSCHTQNTNTILNVGIGCVDN